MLKVLLVALLFVTCVHNTFSAYILTDLLNNTLNALEDAYNYFLQNSHKANAADGLVGVVLSKGKPIPNKT